MLAYFNWAISFDKITPNGPWLYGVASLRDLSVSNRDEPRGGEMQLVHHHHLAMTYEPLLCACEFWDFQSK